MRGHGIPAAGLRAWVRHSGRSCRARFPVPSGDGGKGWLVGAGPQGQFGLTGRTEAGDHLSGVPVDGGLLGGVNPRQGGRGFRAVVPLPAWLSLVSAALLSAPGGVNRDLTGRSRQRRYPGSSSGEG